MYEKLKSFVQNEQVFNTFLIVFVAFASFFLGRASIDSEVKDVVDIRPITLTAQSFSALSPSLSSEFINSTSVPAEAAVSVLEGSYVASRAGTKYHHVTCSGAKLIKTENKIFFVSPIQAEAAGYSRAANCDI